MKDKLLIIGASGHGKVVADIALKMNKWQYIALLDDDESISTSMGLEVIGKSSDTKLFVNEYDIFVGIGNNSIREKVQKRLLNEGATIPTLLHPSAIIGAQVELGAGTVIMAGAVINCCTKIGNGCIINTSATVDHDNFLDDFVHLSPSVHLAGTVKIGKRTWLGIGSVVSNNINIMSDCTLGAGAVVVKDITETGIYVGIPARRVNINENTSIS